MELPLVTRLVLDLLTVLAAGLVSGVICKRLGISVLVGYLLVGALIGEGGLGLVAEENRSLEYLARAVLCYCCSRSASNSCWMNWSV